MEKIKGGLFFLGWSTIGLVITILIWNLPWRFQVNDDEVMMWLVSGAYTGTPETYAVFIHPLISWSLAQLYTLSPLIPWYPITWFMVVYSSFVAGVYAISNHSFTSLYKTLLVLVLLSISIHFLFFLQFTQVAGFATLGGLLLVLNSRKSMLPLVLGGGLLVVGALIRMEAMVLVSVGFVTWAFFNFGKGELLDYSKKLGPVCLITVFLIAGKALWEKNSDYSDFLAFNKARSSVIDHPVFYRQVVNEDIDQDSPWFFFSRWFFEEGAIDLQQLRGMKSQLDAELFSIEQVESTLVRIYSVQMAEAFKSFLWVIVISLFLGTQNMANKKFLVGWILGMLFLNHFFVFYGRVMVLFLLVLLIPICYHLPTGRRRKLFFGLIPILILAITIHTLNFLEEGRGREIMKKEMLQLTGELPIHEPIFLEGYQEHMFGLTYHSLRLTPFINQGWLSRSPFQKKILDRFHVHHIHELPSYSLLAIRMDEPVVFPAYMKKLNPSFGQIDYKTSPNFQLFRFRRETADFSLNPLFHLNR